VLDVVRSRSQVEQQWVEARAQVFVEFIALNKALGGGWELGPVPPVAAAVTTTLSPTARVAPSL
jgi:outer membrane protein TolC